MHDSSSLQAAVFWILACLGASSVCGTQPVQAQMSQELLRQYRAEEFKSRDGGMIPYRILTPPSLEPGQTYPLVLFLHGAGERGNDNQAQLVHGASEFARADRQKKHPAFVVFPQCPVNQRWVESAWDLPSGKNEFEVAPSKPMSLTLDLVDTLIRDLPIDPNRVYVTGLSMGGQGTWFAAVSKPHRFAAMLEVCGGGDPSWADQYAGIPVWAFHGQKDTVVPISRAREMIVGLTEAGHSPELRYTEYPNVGHNSWSQTFKRDDVFDWLFSQRKR